MVGRNDLCPCGSGKKHKKCCGRPRYTLNPRHFDRVLQAIARKGPLTVSMQELNEIPKEEALAWTYDPDTESFTIESRIPPPPQLIQVAKTMPRLSHGQG